MRPVSVAPMMDTTDRHFRYVLRRISRRALLYTEMIPASAALRGDRERLLGFDESERPLALQLGGDDPAALAECARIAADLGYDEVNLNVGCPSDRVREGSFGACLMARPELVARCVAAMRAAVPLPVTVKHRIGIDLLDRYEDMLHFVDVVAAAGADRFSVHARKAWLSGLSPKQNRTVPPLRHAEVHQLKRERPDLVIEVNGGISGAEQVAAHLAHVDAVMIGRGVVAEPYQLASYDARFFADPAPPPSRVEVARAVLPYLAAWHARGVGLQVLTRALLGLFAGQRGAGAWRRALSEDVRREGVSALERVLDRLDQARAQIQPRS
ncbi:MAG: tRNA dihydrouridine(20/20a) synthase DusA [Planctomycetota bacterium]